MGKLRTDADKDIDGLEFYLGSIDPDATFNRIEITLSHIFRRACPALGGKHYSDCLMEYLKKTNHFRPSIIEVGGGLGDLALNHLSSSVSTDTDRYTMYDVSPGLFARQHSKLDGLAADFILGNALELSKKITSFQGLILSNGMIADLRSVYISQEDSLQKYGIEDEDLEDFVKDWGNQEEGWYLHVGSLFFLREIATALRSGGTAAILEYKSSRQNQPTFFENHAECGIDFDQVRAYAERLGFHTQLVDIEDVIDIARNEQFLTMDVFTNQTRFAHLHPAAVKLWSAEKELPVLAYTRKSLFATLVSEPFFLSEDDAQRTVSALDDCFHSIHDERFDSKNPTTWSYQCLLLQKQSVPEWIALTEDVVVPVLAEITGASHEEARKRWNRWSGQAGMGLEQPLIEAIIGGLVYELVRSLGLKVWKHQILPRLNVRLKKMRVSIKDRKRVIRAFRTALRRKKEQEGESRK